MCDSDVDNVELRLKSYAEYLAETDDDFIIRCSSCNVNNKAKLWKPEAICPNCGCFGWSVGF